MINVVKYIPYDISPKPLEPDAEPLQHSPEAARQARPEALLSDAEIRALYAGRKYGVPRG